MPFEFASSDTYPQLIYLHQRFVLFSFLGVVSPSTLVSYFFTTSSQKKKKNHDVLGILIICQHCFTFNFFKKIYVLRIFIPKILPII